MQNSETNYLYSAKNKLFPLTLPMKSVLDVCCCFSSFCFCFLSPPPHPQSVCLLTSSFSEQVTPVSSAERREASVTRMLVVVCVIFTICSSPAVARPFVDLFVDGFQPAMRYENIMYASISIMHMMTSFNSSINFVIYYVMSTRFRSTLKKMLKVKSALPKMESKTTLCSDTG